MAGAASAWLCRVVVEMRTAYNFWCRTSPGVRRGGAASCGMRDAAESRAAAGGEALRSASSASVGGGGSCWRPSTRPPSKAMQRSTCADVSPLAGSVCTCLAACCAKEATSSSGRSSRAIHGPRLDCERNHSVISLARASTPMLVRRAGPGTVCATTVPIPHRVSSSSTT
eukprot:scaffold15662_cov109-Isochrysis_galbana.AAC.8